jgi:polyisoprenyl-teichoic acid--peptidoglycan teichoic acid transferase
VTPPRKGKGGDDEERRDDTQEYELGEDFLEDLTDEEELEPEGEEEELDEDYEDEDYEDDEEYEDEDYDEDEEPLEEDEELDEVVSAETQEWDGLEAAEEEEEGEAEKTLVSRAGSTVTSGFQAVGKGARVVRSHVGFPVWLRFLTASFVIVIAIAGATSASLILYLSDIANALKHGSILEGVQPFLKTPGSGPQTILILGSDKRTNQISGKYGNSDTTMLLRLDPDRNAISLLSIPRDLKVDIPGYGTNKINAAYSLGGPKLTLQTVKAVTGLQINHLVNVDFTGFARAVNAIGCVFVDVDRRYYIAPNSGTAEINLQPGYQALCGFDALSFARYRHTDTDIVRAARQQEFLREARAKVPPEKLFEDRSKLIKIFTHYTSSDINSAEQMLQVLRLFFDLRGAQVKEVHFDATLGPSYVYASQSQIQSAVQQFIGSEGTPGAPTQNGSPTKTVQSQRPPDYSKPHPAAPTHHHHPSQPQTNLVRTTYGRQLAQGIRARKEKVPVYYPTLLETGSDYAQKPRVYKINGKGDGAPPHDQRAAYKWVFSLPGLGDYYGFEGTSWQDPPILDDSSEEKTIGDRTYKLYYDGDRLRMVAWQTDEGSFWVSNSLIETVPNEDMLKIAEGFRQLPGT